MTTLKFQNRLAKLMKAGDVQTVHHELARLPLKEALNFNLLQSWVEILSCTGMASVQSALRGARTGRLSVAERTIVNSFLVVEHWLQQDWQRLESLVAASLGQAKYEVGGKDVVNAQSHMKLCVRLFAYRLQHPADYGRHAAHSLIAIGDSHCLVPAGRTIQWGGRQVSVQSMPIRGIKMFHLGLGVPAKYRAYFRRKGVRS